MWKGRRKASRETGVLCRSTSKVSFVRSSLKDVENLFANEEDIDGNETLGLPSPCSTAATATSARRLSIFHRVHLANKFARAFSVKQAPSPEKCSPESNDDVTPEKLTKSDGLFSIPAKYPLESNNDVTKEEKLAKSDRLITFPAKSSPECYNFTTPENVTKHSPESNNDVTAAEELTKPDREISIPAKTTAKSSKSDRTVTTPAKSSSESNNDVTAEEKSTKTDHTITIPGSKNRVVIYTTSLRVVRPTFEACRTVQSILRGFRVSIDERDLSMDSTFLHELQNLIPNSNNNNNNNNNSNNNNDSEKTKVTLPRVFIGGKYIGGAEEVKELHESGELKKIVEGLPAVNAAVCGGCGDVRFVMCDECRGSHKCYYSEKGGFRSCTLCNENGLVRCPDCLD